MQTVSSSKFHAVHLSYVRNSRAVAVLWCVFSVCFVIINIVVFTNPWLASTDETKKEGYFSLWESCVFDNSSHVIFTDLGMPVGNAYEEYRFFCEGNWKVLYTSVNPAATFFIGISALLNLISLGTFLFLFLFISPTIVFSACGGLQAVSTICMFLGVVTYPAVWGSPRVREVCETSNNFNTGNCEVKLSYVLAILGIFDILILSVLAFVLGRVQVSNYKPSRAQGSFRQIMQPSENLSYNNDSFKY